MKRHFEYLSAALGLALAMAWFGGCSAEQKHEPDAEAGHNHGSPGAHAHEAAGTTGECPEHAVPTAQCGICKPEIASRLNPGESAKIRLPAKDSAALAGLETERPTVGNISEAIECYAELTFNQDRLAQITAPVGGVLQNATAELGAKVKEAQTVAQIWSATIAEGVAKAVLSHQTLERERRLRTQRVTSERDLQQAEAEHQAACQQLRTFGFSEGQIEELATAPRDQVLMDVRAPFAGEIIERNAVRGALVEPGKSLFTVADLSTMWAMLNIPESALSRVRLGQEVELRVASLPNEHFSGKLAWISATVDERSRMARARVEVANPGGLLKARMFAQARIITRSSTNALLLPSSALQRISDRDFVFVRVGEDLFDARVIRCRARQDGFAEITEGLDPQDQVAVKHTFTLKSAFLISRLGAGCADD